MILQGCGAYIKTKFGKVRYSWWNNLDMRFSVKDNLKKPDYIKIDTNSIYRLISEEYKNISSSSLSCEFLKFYSNGKVGRFDCGFYKDSLVLKRLNSKHRIMGYYLKSNVLDGRYFRDSLTSETLNPEYADMGYFTYNGKSFVTETLGNSWHGTYGHL